MLNKKCDVCIIGAGPAGLATLSAIHEPYTLDTMSDRQVTNANSFMDGSKRMKTKSRVGPSRKNICVVDPHPNWLDGWTKNFASLGIDFLRSPAMAHPDHFDQGALLAYAVTNNRENELIESGCSDNKNLLIGEKAIGLWKLPSTSLFNDFCQNLASKLAHDYIEGLVVDVDRDDKDDSFILSFADGSNIRAKSVVLALGTIGDPVELPKLRKEDVPKSKIFSWKTMKKNLKKEHKEVLVIGGGLTAVQTAQYALRQGKKVHLCSRRPLVERHFDIGTDWFDRRTANRNIFDFYHQDDSNRLSALAEARGGGSVPPIYMKDLRNWQKSGHLKLVSAEAKFVSMTEAERVEVSLGDKEVTKFDCIILACGIKPDCTANPLIRNIQDKWPVQIIGGFPNVSVDLEWTKNLFVVGGLASLNTGPDSGNIAGMRRAASLVASTLECKCWLRQESSALTNPYDLFWDEDDSESDTDTDSEI